MYEDVATISTIVLSLVGGDGQVHTVKVRGAYQGGPMYFTINSCLTRVKYELGICVPMSSSKRNLGNTNKAP